MESRVRSRQDKRGRGVIGVSCKAGMKLQPILQEGASGGRGSGGRVLGKYPPESKGVAAHFSPHPSQARWPGLLP